MANSGKAVVHCFGICDYSADSIYAEVVISSKVHTTYNCYYCYRHRASLLN